MAHATILITRQWHCCVFPNAAAIPVAQQELCCTERTLTRQRSDLHIIMHVHIAQLFFHRLCRHLERQNALNDGSLRWKNNEILSGHMVLDSFDQERRQPHQAAVITSYADRMHRQRLQIVSDRAHKQSGVGRQNLACWPEGMEGSQSLCDDVES